MEVQNRFCVIFDKGIEMICETMPVALCTNVFEHKRVSSVISDNESRSGKRSIYIRTYISMFFTLLSDLI